MRVAVVVAVGACIGVAFFVGRATAGGPIPVDSPSGVVKKTRSAPEPAPTERTRRTLSGLVCASRAPARDGESREELDLRARWCQAELDECQRQRQAVRNDWPTQDTIEQPDVWTDAVEQALTECEIPGELELVDCTEYPCTAALRPPEPAADAKAFELQMRAAMNAVRACQPLREAFDLADEEVIDALDVYRLDAECGGGKEKFLVLTALDPAGPAHTLLHMDDRTAEQDRDFNRWMYRRADDLSALWPCEG